MGVRRGIRQSTRVLPPSIELLPRSGRSFLVALALSSKSLAFKVEPSDKPVRRSLLPLSCLPFAPSLSTASPSTFLAHGGEG